MKILLAEDDPHMRDGLVELLSDEGYKVIACADGQEALDAFAKQIPDFALLDIMMPKRNGYDVCRAIRSQNVRIPIVFLSAKSEEIDRVLGLELGADDFISKPFGSRELLARIRTISRRLLAQQEEKAPLRSFWLGDVEVFPQELRVKRGDSLVDVSLRDLSLLELFAKSKGKVLDRNALFNAGWGADFIGSTRTLDQHISQLRKKIEKDPAEPCIIRTVHGVGYRFED